MKQHRLANTTYRLLHTEGEEQARAFDRLIALAGFIPAYHLWLMTKPDIDLAEAILEEYLARTCPFRSVYTRK